MSFRAAALIVAAGSGIRAGGHLPKQYCRIGGEPVLRRTLARFVTHEDVADILVVIREGDEALYHGAVAGLPATKLLPPVRGGASRQRSVSLGLEALAASAPHAVLIHDAARPFVTAGDIDATLAAIQSHDGAIVAAPLADTLKRGANGAIVATVSRAGLWRAQTPQTFHFQKILEAHRAAARLPEIEFTDDASIAEWHGLKVALVETSAANMKITTAEDLGLADLMAAAATETAQADVRVGTGFDVHAFEDGDRVILCGVEIPHSRRLKGHSDADAGLHALTDALLGTIGAGDIGDHFPPSDPQWRGAPSSIFLGHAAALVRERGGRITNVDIMLVCEVPKIGPHRETMRERMASLLGIDRGRVSVKATTNEGLGFIGRREGIAALATATVVFAGAAP